MLRLAIPNLSNVWQITLKDTSLIKDFNNNDIFLRPTNTLFRNYDIIIGSKNLETPLEYNIYSRNYFHMLNGKVEITLCSPQNYKYLHIINDYEKLNFYSNIITC